MTQFDVTLRPSKGWEMLEAGKRYLSPGEFGEFASLLVDMQIYGLSPWINSRLAALMSKLEKKIEEMPSEWPEALKACDGAFLGEDLKRMCLETGVSSSGHKKQLCARLYRAKVPEVVAVMEPFLKGMTVEKVREEVLQYAQVQLLPQTEHLYVSKLRAVKDRLEEVYRAAPDEFYRRKDLIKKAIHEREKGKTRNMPEFTLEELRELLKFTERLYS